MEYKEIIKYEIRYFEGSHGVCFIELYKKEAQVPCILQHCFFE